MKIFDKIGLIVFSAIVLVISIVVCILIFGWMDIHSVATQIDNILSGPISGNVVFVIQILLIALAIKALFFSSGSKEGMKKKAGITLENDNGKLLVSKDAVENLANLVVKNFDSIANVATKVEVDNETNIKILITLQVHQDAIIKDLTSKLQTDVKAAVKKSLNLDIKEVTIRVKDIAVKKEQTTN